jgi:hypothetical protein
MFCTNWGSTRPHVFPGDRSWMGTMHEQIKKEPQIRNNAAARPLLTSYDSGYEHSFDHWVELQNLIDEAESTASSLALAANG